MTFEEEFPIVAPQVIKLKDDCGCERDVLKVSTVAFDCLDKQRVKEILLDCYNAFQDDAGMMYDAIIEDLKL